MPNFMHFLTILTLTRSLVSLASDATQSFQEKKHQNCFQKLANLVACKYCRRIYSGFIVVVLVGNFDFASGKIASDFLSQTGTDSLKLTMGKCNTYSSF